MKFIDIIFIVGLFLMSIGAFSAVALLRLSILKSKEELKDLNVANLWMLFSICLPTGLFLMCFWF